MPSITSASRFSHVVYYFLLSMSSKRRHLSFTSTDLFDEVGLPSRYSSNMSVPGSFPQLSTTTGVCKFDRIVFVQATPRMQPERWYKAWSFYVRGDRNLRYWGSILPVRAPLPPFPARGRLLTERSTQDTTNSLSQRSEWLPTGVPQRPKKTPPRPIITHTGLKNTHQLCARDARNAT